MRVLALAYACEPDKGSEPGAGWAMVRLIEQFAEVTVITRRNNRESIETALASAPTDSTLRFVYVDLPRWAMSWKRGHRGVRLYYLLWQFAALRAGRALNRQERFDAVWHVTMANAWLGSLGSLIGPSFVYGPIGAGVDLPRSALRSIGWKGRLYESTRGVVRRVGRFLNPIARVAWSGADLILVQNPETERWLPSRHRSKMVTFSNAIVDGTYQPRQRADGRTALFAGRLLHWKGCDLALRGIAGSSGWRLIVCGEGPDERRLKAICHELGLEDRVDWRGWVSRQEVQRVMREEADAFLLPTLHDEGSAAVVEAMFAGLPVVCLDRGGPAILVGSAGVAIPSDRPIEEIVEAIQAALESGLPSDEMVAARCAELSFDSRALELRKIIARRYPIALKEVTA